MSIKVSTFIPSLYSQGAEYVTASIAMGMCVLGLNVEVLVNQINEDTAQSVKDQKPFKLGDGIKLVKLRGRRARDSFWVMRNYIRAARPHVFLCNATQYIIPIVLANLSLPKIQRTKVILVEHSGGIGLDANGAEITPKLSITKKIFAWILKKTDAVFAVSEGCRRAINRVYGYPLEKSYTVYNPVYDNDAQYNIMPPPKHPWLREKTCTTFVAAGALTGWKNFDLLIDAFYLIAKDNKHSRLIIFGEGKLRKSLEEKVRVYGIEDQIDLPGYTNQLPSELKNADAFVLSSEVESFSVVLVEAIVARVNIISTDAPYGPCEILHNGEYGDMIPRRNKIELAKAMQRVIEGKGRKVPISCAMPYTVENTVERYMNGIKKIMATS